MTARPIVPGNGHGAVLAAVRTLLADGKAYSADELRALGIAQKLLVPATIPNYVRNAIKTLLDRQHDRGEKPEFALLRDGRYRLDMPVDAFAQHDDPEPSNPAIEALIARLEASAHRRTPPDPDDGSNIGPPFERDVAAVSLDDVRAAASYGVHPRVDTMSLDGDRITIEARWTETRSAPERKG
jgi:hypothetical protein